MIYNDEYFMDIALKEAHKAYKLKEVPVGCCIVKNNKIISKAYNCKYITNKALNHAEIRAINKASNRLHTTVFDDCDIYITLEPCVMCAGLIMQSRFKRVIYATNEPKFGALGSIINLNNPEYKFNHHLEVLNGIKKEESSDLLKKFFKEIRVKNNK